MNKKIYLIALLLVGVLPVGVHAESWICSVFSCSLFEHVIQDAPYLLLPNGEYLMSVATPAPADPLMALTPEESFAAAEVPLEESLPEPAQGEEVPEFTTLAALMVLAILGVFILRRRTL